MPRPTVGGRTPAEFALGTITHPDGDRLASLLLERIQQASGPFSERELESWEAAAVYDPSPDRDSLHRDIPPLGIAVATAWYRAGLPLRAEQALERRRQAAVAARADDRSVEQCETALLWLALRMRWRSYQPTLVGRFLDHPTSERARRLGRSLLVLANGEPPTDDLAGGLDPALPDDVHPLEIGALLDRRAGPLAASPREGSRKPPDP